MKNFHYHFLRNKKTIKDDNERKEFLAKFEELIKSGSNDDVSWKNYEKYRNIAEKIIEEELTKEQLIAKINKIEGCFPSQGASSI